MSSSQPVSADRRLPRGHLLVLNRSFRRTLEAENKRPRTIEAYTDAVRLLATYCQARGHPVLAGELQREHIQLFIADQLARWKPATAHNRYRGLHAFFKWAMAEGDLEVSPMGGMRPPQLPEQPVEVVGPEHLARLLKACQGRDFTSRRDTAVILLLVDTGMRRAEGAGMTLDDVDLDQRMVWVLGKGRRPRALPIGRRTAQALDRSLRGRDEHRLGHLPHLWVGRNRPWPQASRSGADERASLSAIEGSTRCGPAFPQLAADRRRRRDAFLAASFQAVQAGQPYTASPGTPAYRWVDDAW